MMLGAVAGVETVRATVETPLAWDCLPAYSRGAGGSRSVADALAAETEETAVGTRDELSSDQCALLLSSALSLRALQSDLTAGVRDCKVQRAVKAVLNVAGLSGILKQLQVPDADRICPGGGGGLAGQALSTGDRACCCCAFPSRTLQWRSPIKAVSLLPRKLMRSDLAANTMLWVCSTYLSSAAQAASA